MLKWITMALSAVFLASCVSTNAPAPNPRSEVVPADPASGASAAIGQLLNAARGQNGLPALAHNAALSLAAERHAQDMARNGFFSHTGSNGSSVSTRIRAAGFTACLYAENIAWGQKSAAEAMTGWMNSPGHRANNLRRGVTHYGAARVGERNYWVLTFARAC